MTFSLLMLIRHSKDDAVKYLSKYKKAQLIDLIIHLCDKWLLPEED